MLSILACFHSVNESVLHRSCGENSPENNQPEDNHTAYRYEKILLSGAPNDSLEYF